MGLTTSEAASLQAKNKSLNKVAASGGSLLIADADPHTGLNASGFYVREDTVVSAMSGNNGAGTTVNFVTLLGISGKTLVQNDFFPIPNGYSITSVTLTSGSIIIYL